jgi:hypothetical protein
VQVWRRTHGTQAFLPLMWTVTAYGSRQQAGLYGKEHGDCLSMHHQCVALFMCLLT